MDDILRDGTCGQPFLRAVYEALEEEKKRDKKNKLMRNVFFAIIVIAAVAVLLVLLLFPVFQISGTSMTDTLSDGDIVIASKSKHISEGEIIAFYYNNNILIKRVIAKEGDWVNLKEDGTVTVNGLEIEEAYVSEKAVGECNVPMPYQVPAGKYFVMGDHRATSIDSRNKEIGCVSPEMIVGKLWFRVWPISELGSLE